jgi:predicted TIM-barrel fold metal-dependent hydrolase
VIVDCHVHLFDPGRFPYQAGTVYTPAPDESAPLEALEAVLEENGVGRAVLVGPVAGYNADNRCLLSALRQNPDRFRGIAIVDPAVSDRKLQVMKAAGVVGARFDLISLGTDYLLTTGADLLKRLIDRDWLIDIQCEGAQLARLMQIFEKGGRFVIDHGGRPEPDAGLEQAGFRVLLDLAGTGRVWVKLSGPFRASTQPWPHGDMDHYFKALVESFGPSRLVWGSDWPFIRLRNKPVYALTLQALERWLPQDADRIAVLEDTPALLFGWISDA